MIKSNYLFIKIMLIKINKIKLLKIKCKQNKIDLNLLLTFNLLLRMCLTLT